MTTVITTNNNNIDTGTGKVICGNLKATSQIACENIRSPDEATRLIQFTNNGLVKIGDPNRSNTNNTLKLFVGSTAGANSSSGSTAAMFEGLANDTNQRGLMNVIGDGYYTFAPTSWGDSLFFYFRYNTANMKGALSAASFFTGQHGNYPLDQDLIINRIKYVGLLVSSADEGYLSLNRLTKEHITGSDAITITEALPKVKITDKDKDAAVWGVITNVANDNVNSNGTMQTDDDTEWGAPRIGTDLIRVNGLGEGALWVTNINGNVCNGDWICSSIIPGYGRKQDDDLFHNYTAAKSTMSCNFDLNNDNLYKCKTIEHNGNTYIAAFIGVSYHCS